MAITSPILLARLLEMCRWESVPIQLWKYLWGEGSVSMFALEDLALPQRCLLGLRVGHCTGHTKLTKSGLFVVGLVQRGQSWQNRSFIKLFPQRIVHNCLKCLCILYHYPSRHCDDLNSITWRGVHIFLTILVGVCKFSANHLLWACLFVSNFKII